MNIAETVKIIPSFMDIASKLVSYPSISPNSSGSLEYIADLLSNHGFVIKWLNRNQTKNIIATYSRGNGAKFAFAGHVDVVPVGDVAKWHTDPFILTEVNGKYLAGRGICDMKGAIACFVTSAIEIVTSPLFAGSISLLITSDEEADATDGTVVISEYCVANEIKFDYCIIGEPSSESYLGDIIKVGRRGSITGYLDIFGIQGHIAYPDLAQNTIHLAMPALVELANMNIVGDSEYFSNTVLQFANIHSGVGVTNVIPGELSANFNVRYNDVIDVEKLKEDIISVLNKHQIKHSISWVHSARPFLSDVSNLFDCAKLAIMQVNQQEVKKSTGGGTSDGRFLNNICEEMIELGLVNKTIHQVNEAALKSDLIELNLIYYKILEQIFYVTKTNTSSTQI